MNGASAFVYTGSMASTRSHELGLLSGAMENGMGPAQLFYRGRTTVPLVLALKAEHCTKDDYSWALRSDGIHSTMFWMCLRHITFHLSYFLLLEWEQLSYAHRPLYFDSTQLVWFHRLADGEELVHTSNLNGVQMKLQTSELMLEQVKGALQVKYTYVTQSEGHELQGSQTGWYFCGSLR